MRQPVRILAPVIDLARRTAHHAEIASAAAYAVWQRHHAGCAVCGVEDWFSPGAPREVFGADVDLFAARPIETPPGSVRSVRFYGDGLPDVTVLCSTGRAAFEGWRQAVVLSNKLGLTWASVGDE